jgi:hypothetical protein
MMRCSQTAGGLSVRARLALVGLGLPQLAGLCTGPDTMTGPAAIGARRTLIGETIRLRMRPKTRYQLALDSLNFFLADVRGGLGPYVSVFLLTEAHWDQATIGAVLTISGIIGITLHTPIGALIDATRYKRGLLVAGVALLTASAIGIAQAPTLPVVLAADIVMAVAGAIFAPTVAAMTLGLVQRS